VLARQSGLSLWEALAMSLFVYAGASQFIAVEMLAAGAAALPIILTVFLVNLRHLLMSATIACHLGRQPLGTSAAVAAELTDESFAVMMCHPEKITHRPRFVIGLQMTAQLPGWAARRWARWAALSLTARATVFPLPCPPCSSVCWCSS
jgi:predicted branched-subunit amino acid permease